MKMITTFLMAACSASLLHAQDTTKKTIPDAKAPLTKILDLAQKGRLNPKEVKIYVQWVNQFGGFPGREATVYGRGVGILNRKTQFTIAQDKVLDALKLFAKFSFDKLKTRYGGFGGRGGIRRGVPERLLGQISITHRQTTKSVTQLGGGEQSKELAGLADALMTIFEKEAKNNAVTADSLGDALKKLGNGTLMPQTCSILVHRIIQKRPLNQSEGYLMRIEGRTVTVQKRIPKKGYGPKSVLELSEKEFQALTTMIAKNDPSRFPPNLWAKHYTDFNVNVLQFRKSMQARQFARLTPKTLGEKQKAFDEIYAALEKLSTRALSKGKVIQETPR